MDRMWLFIQPASACSYALGTTQVQAPATGTSGSIAVTTSCPVIATSSQPWVTAIALSSSVNYLITANVSTSIRTAAITIGDQTIQITQDVPQTITFPNPGTQTYGVAPITLTASASSGLAVSYAVTSGAATVSGSTLTITGAGSVTVQATQAGNVSYATATPVSISFAVNPATLTVTANNAVRLYGTANPAFTYIVSGFVNGNTSAVVSGAASLATTATTSSPVGMYPITFST